MMYVCEGCKSNVHKNCMERIRDTCSMNVASPSAGGTIGKKQYKLIDKIISRKPSTHGPATSE